MKKFIDEDYCSLEVAKLLKEHGFNDVFPKGDCVQHAVTHQMALKWLREQGIFIIVDVHEHSFFPTVFTRTKRAWALDNDYLDSASTYEEAVEIGLKYVLSEFNDIKKEVQ